jgi:hypothetical protein
VRAAGKRALDLVKDDAWMKKDFIPNVQKRGAGICRSSADPT